jgi:O-antigen ligase
VVGLDPALTWRTAVGVVGTGLTGLVYLFVINEKPRLAIPLSLVILVQGSVALGQFLNQHDLGLSALGEFSLDPTRSGVIVLFARDQRWLRAYGLTAHPNLLGATLAVLLLLMLGPLSRARGVQRLGAVLVASVGLLGLMASFSRTSWFALALGVAVWTVRSAWDRTRHVDGPRLPRGKLPLRFILPLVLAGIFLFTWRDLVTSRFVKLDTPIESRSINDRRRDADLAMELIVAHPWRGVGSGNYVPAVRAIEPDSRAVHNTPLLVGAELGVLAAVLWLWLALAGLWAPPSAAAPWAAMIVVSMFDTSLWMGTSWRAAVLFAILAAGVAESRSR